MPDKKEMTEYDKTKWTIAGVTTGLVIEAVLLWYLMKVELWQMIDDVNKIGPVKPPNVKPTSGIISAVVYCKTSTGGVGTKYPNVTVFAKDTQNNIYTAVTDSNGLAKINVPINSPTTFTVTTTVKDYPTVTKSVTFNGYSSSEGADMIVGDCPILPVVNTLPATITAIVHQNTTSGAVLSGASVYANAGGTSRQGDPSHTGADGKTVISIPSSAIPTSAGIQFEIEPNYTGGSPLSKPTILIKGGDAITLDLAVVMPPVPGAPTNLRFGKINLVSHTNDYSQSVVDEQLLWNAPSGSVTGYYLYVTDPVSSMTFKTDIGNLLYANKRNTYYCDQPVKTGIPMCAPNKSYQVYIYRVSARNASGEGPKSEPLDSSEVLRLITAN